MWGELVSPHRSACKERDGGTTQGRHMDHGSDLRLYVGI